MQGLSTQLQHVFYPELYYNICIRTCLMVININLQGQIFGEWGHISQEGISGNRERERLDSVMVSAGD